MLPDQNGFDTARHIRSDGCEVPILMLTALSGTRDKVNGLDAGADDYLTKPFEFEELAARIRALLRRHSSAPSARLSFSELEMDLIQRTVTRSGKSIELTTKEFSLLEYFMRNPNRVLSRASISEHVWDVSFDTQSNVIDVYVNTLRKKLELGDPSAPNRRLIHTVVGAGYVLREKS
jgi:DNA-binding response OmpR family regulator